MKKHTLLMSCALAAVLASPQAFAAAAAGSSAGSGATTIGEVVVTAERRETNLQDTPIAVSAFSADTLKNEKVLGGQDLLLQVPNANYSRTNFGGFNFKIRGVGTDVIGRGGTQGVSINENELPVTVSTFANSNFFDVDRVEVLRGPQGTLYGRNATGGAVNVITTQPSAQFGGFGAISYGNYNQIIATGAVNIPIGDTLAVRIAGTREVQDGVGLNEYLDRRVDGRDLGAMRITLAFKPSDRFSAYLMFEHYGEDDTRNRVGKQLCIKDPGPSSVGGVATNTGQRDYLTQGCLPGSVYQSAAYGSVNSNGTLGGEVANSLGLTGPAGAGFDVYANNPLQDRNLHNIDSVIQPLFTQQNDLVELHMAWNITDDLTLTSISGFDRNVGTSAEDYNRLIPSTPFMPTGIAAALFPNGVVNDPQTGRSNLFTSFDYGDQKSKEYTQEIRLSSSFKGPVNFTVGGFYSELDGANPSSNYYVESSSLTALSLVNNFAYDATYAGYIKAGAPAAAAAAAAAAGAPLGGLIHIDQNNPPNGSGHNYFNSRTGGDHLKSYAGFGEFYWDITPQLKLTVGARYTVDQLYNPQIPVELLSTTPNGGTTYTDPGFPISQYPGLAFAGFPNGVAGAPTPVAGGFPTTVCTTSLTSCNYPQRATYREVTGRANIQWTPTISFTDKSMIYAQYARGYKGGGFNTACQSSLGGSGGSAAACGYPLSYNPEFINAFEVGTKNTVLGGRAQLNLTGFYYDYTGYQVARIISESAVNFNYNAKIYGVEFEGILSPVRNLTLNANVGWTHSRLDDNQYSQNSIDPTQGNTAYTLLKSSGQQCLGLTSTVAAALAAGVPGTSLGALCLGGPGLPTLPASNPASGQQPNPLNPDGTQIKFGVAQNLGGNELPNTPQFTVSVGAQYVFELMNDWTATLRGDFYWQDHSSASVYNDVSSYLKSYDYVNATLTFANRPAGLELQLFVKNAFNSQPITGIYLTDPTSGLFRNVFTLDPREYGAQLTKRF